MGSIIVIVFWSIVLISGFWPTNYNIKEDKEFDELMKETEIKAWVKYSCGEGNRQLQLRMLEREKRAVQKREKEIERIEKLTTCQVI